MTVAGSSFMSRQHRESLLLVLAPLGALIDASKSTKGASKLRRDLINAEIANLRDLLPLPPSTRQRLSQLQLMALVCVFLRKANYFQRALKPVAANPESSHIPMPNIGFSKAMSGFIMMMTQQGKLLYISENATEYLGHSMEDLLIHGDSIYDVIDKHDHASVQNQLSRSLPGSSTRRLFLCRINVSRNTRRQLRFGDQKVVLVEGRYLPFVPLCNRGDTVFLASCTPVVLPETRESVVQGATNIFTTIHSMDMKYLHVDKTAESHMEYSRGELLGVSWYNLLHWESIRTAHCKHQAVIQSDQERSSTALLRLQNRSGKWFWVHCVLQVKDTTEECQHPVIVCTNQVLSEDEAAVMRNSSWLYQHDNMSVSRGNKFAYGLPTLNCDPDHRQQRQVLSYNNHEYVRRNLVTYNSRESTTVGIEEARRVEKSDLEYTLTKKMHVGRESGAAEPVDMSMISCNGTEIEQRRTLRILSKALTFNIRNKSKHCSSSAVASVAGSGGNGSLGYVASGCGGSNAAISHSHVLGQVVGSSASSLVGSSPRCSPKYVEITDLDKGYAEGVASIVASTCTATAIDSSYNSQRRLVIKTATIVEPAEACGDPWGATGNLWADTLQKVPEIVQQELCSPYVLPVVPGTDPVPLPNDGPRCGTPIFNIDWQGTTDYHVPNFKLDFRNVGHESRRNLMPRDVQPIALQFPRRKGGPADLSKGFTK